jgi:hypothetical protein
MSTAGLLVVYGSDCVIDGLQRNVCEAALSHFKGSLNVAVEWVVLLFHIWDVPGSTFGSETGYLDRSFHRLPQCQWANITIVSQIGYGHFIPHPSQSIIRYCFCCSTLYKPILS